MRSTRPKNAAPGWNQPKGTLKWLRDRVGYTGDDCLIWPFHARDGRAKLRHGGKLIYAARLMCTLAHGDPPTPEHQAAHSCGNGHLRCVNPRHLSWKTKAENTLDCRQHGTQARGRRGFKLNFAKAQEIRALQGKRKLCDVARLYQVSNSTVDHIWKGRTFKSEKTGLHPSWTPAEDDRLLQALALGLSKPETAVFVGRPANQLYRRRARLGLPKNAVGLRTN